MQLYQDISCMKVFIQSFLSRWEHTNSVKDNKVKFQKHFAAQFVIAYRIYSALCLFVCLTPEKAKQDLKMLPKTKDDIYHFQGPNFNGKISKIFCFYKLPYLEKFSRLICLGFFERDLVKLAMKMLAQYPNATFLGRNEKMFICI